MILEGSSSVWVQDGVPRALGACWYQEGSSGWGQAPGVSRACQGPLGSLLRCGRPLPSPWGHGSLVVSPPSPGIFAFKCSRAEEIFNLLQDLMQCNSINVMEEPVISTRNSHPTELDLLRGPQPPGEEPLPPTCRCTLGEWVSEAQVERAGDGGGAE